MLYTSVVVLVEYIRVYFVQVDKETRKKTVAVSKGSPLVAMLQGERRGSLEFTRNETAFIDFRKKFGDDIYEVMPDIMADTSDDHHEAMR